jgi:hypothetical protein
MGYTNQTNGVFDIEKESVIVSDIVVGDLMDNDIINDENADRASLIAKELFLAFRRNQQSTASYNIKIDTKLESDALAKIIVDAFIESKIITKEGAFRSFEIAAEEILVRRAMESL